MNKWNTQGLVEADKKYVWHPFTSMAEWCATDHEPIVLVEGQGALLRDSRGREYIDGNSSIWTNIHGHNHPHINAAIRQQLDRVAHTSFLGFTNPPAIELAKAIVELFPTGTFSRVFYSDDGSTGMEVAMRIASQYWQLHGSSRHRFISFRDAYHGDTAGAASLGAAQMFQTGFPQWRFPGRQINNLEELHALPDSEAKLTAAVVIEPLIQGAAGMKIWLPGILRAVREWCDRTGVLLIVDEVMTGFGRTGKMFASEHETVGADIMILAKALTGGYLPLAITLITDKIFRFFSKFDAPAGTLFYGHSYTGNALACAAAKASLEVFEREKTLEILQTRIAHLKAELSVLSGAPLIKEVRQCGFIAAVELDDRSFGKAGRVGAEVCIAARRYGLLTRAIRDVVVLMPPFSISLEQLTQAVQAIRQAIRDVYAENSQRISAGASR
ncbi:MAG: adenosylmethionine--8-amino-7-oxononanoate transaminase [Verrucomicrobiota bacterium]